MRSRAQAYAAQAEVARAATARVQSASAGAAALDEVAAVSGATTTDIASVSSDISSIRSRLTAAGIP